LLHVAISSISMRRGKRWLAVCAALTGALVFASVGLGSSNGIVPNGPTDPIAAQAQTLTLRATAEMGDNAPTGLAVSGLVTRNTALAAMDGGGQIGGADGTASGYYLVVAHGNFTATDADVPNGVAYPTGTVLVLVVDSVTGDVTDTGLLHGASALHTSSLGTMTAIASN
jgi:hypothetical protein